MENMNIKMECRLLMRTPEEVERMKAEAVEETGTPEEKERE